jgi:predicted nucleotidyltransferase component of viral defense system
MTHSRVERQKHEQILKNLLRDIYSTPELQGRLTLKGGTCLYLFYTLDRFSVDLDFNLIAQDFPAHLMTALLSKYLTLDEQISKHFITWFWLGSYERDRQRIKIEISKRDFPDTYITKNFYGLTVPRPTACKADGFMDKL